MLLAQQEADMSGTTANETLANVSCHVCHQEVPQADALTAEGQEYLYYFCGRGCYARWEHEASRISPAREGSHDHGR